MLRWYVQILFIVVGGLWNSHSWAGPNDSTNNIIKNSILDYFNPYPGLTAEQDQDTLDQLLETRKQSELVFPAFPRTWIELGSGEPVETTTRATFDTGKIASAIGTFVGPFSFPARVILSGAQLNYSSEYSIRYAYNKETTFMAMTSMRAIDPNATENNTQPMSLSDPRLRSVIEQKKDLRTYFRVSQQFPMVGLCKYEMSLIMEETREHTISFIFGSSSEAKKIVGRMSYTIYSNFFPIESNMPIQEYLRTRCGDSFTEAVRFLAEEDFTKMVTDTFAHYHPQSQCRWSPSTNVSPQGDQDCLGWFNDLNIAGLDKSVTVPRCVLGNQGFPVCAVRSKNAAYCPTYASQGKIYTKEPARWERQLNPMDNTGFLNQRSLYQCDIGLSCKLENGMSVSQIPLTGTEPERRQQLLNANYITTCQRPARHGR